MRLYLDAFSNEEIFSDSFPMEFIFERVGCKVKAKWEVVGEVNVDIGCGNAFGGAEGEQEKGLPDDVEKSLNILNAFSYQETTFTKKDWMEYIKEYMKKVKAYLEDRKPDRVKDFMENAQKMVKWILSRFDDITFYTPPSYDSENIIILSLFDNDEDEAPTFVYFMDGLREEKL